VQADRAWLRGHLLAQGVSPRVVEAMMSVPRERFVPPDLRPFAWEDRALPIGHGQTISQPTVVAVMTEAVDVGPGDAALDVGCGSGYQAAVLAACGAHVVGLERIRVLADRARARLAELGLDVPVLCGDGIQGGPGPAYDAIVVAAATPEAPEALVAQLRPPGEGRRGGRMVVPLGDRSGWAGGQQLVLLERLDEVVRRRSLLDVVFVPLVPGTVRRE